MIDMSENSIKHYYLIKELLDRHAKNFESVLDIGCWHGILKDVIGTGGSLNYVGVDKFDYDIETGKPLKRRPDIVADVNKDKLPLSSNSFDIVVISNILEHLWDVRNLIKETNRLAKKWIVIGLPNAKAYDNRILTLLGKEKMLPPRDFNSDENGGHHQYFWYERTLNMIKNEFPKYKLITIRGLCQCSGSRFIPSQIKNWLANKRPTLFASEIYYLLKKYKI